MKIGLFYGSTTCYTEMAAEKIQAQLGEAYVDIHNIRDIPLSRTDEYAILIFGLSTWDFGELQEDWENHWAEIRHLDLQDKIVALYGLGDQENYSDWFQDALGMLHQELTPLGCHFIGYWPNSDEYEFTHSKALTADQTQFVGLALDDDSQFELTDDRIKRWCQQLQQELAELGLTLAD